MSRPSFLFPVLLALNPGICPVHARFKKREPPRKCIAFSRTHNSNDLAFLGDIGYNTLPRKRSRILPSSLLQVQPPLSKNRCDARFRTMEASKNRDEDAQQQMFAMLLEIQKTQTGILTTLEGTKKEIHDLQMKVDFIVVKDLRSSASMLFGESFSKSFSIKSLHDAIHLLSKADGGELSPERLDRQAEKAEALAEEVEENMIPLAKAMLASTKKFGEDLKEEEKEDYDLHVENATEEYNAGHYAAGLGQLIAAARSISNESARQKIERLKKAFVTTNQDVEENKNVKRETLLSCDGPGVMLLEAFKFKDLPSRVDIFDEGFLFEELEFDMRGTVQLFNGSAMISCGEAKSSMNDISKARKQIEVRLHFMKNLVEIVYPNRFKHFVLKGHIFLPKHVQNDKTQQPPNEVSNSSIWFYNHFV